jgi:8-oxo-dGTP diphosphatase
VKIIEKVALAIICDRKVLLARSKKNKQVFYTLGGKIEDNETDEQCLVREIEEEVKAKIDKSSLIYLGIFEAYAHDKPNTLIRVSLYKGELIGEPTPSSEVEEIKYFNSRMPKINQSDLTHKVLVHLKDLDYIN